MRRLQLFCLALLVGTCLQVPFALAQDKGTVEPKSLPPLVHPEDPSTPAKQLFGRKSSAAPLAARAIGFYSRGCLAGGQALPINGETWQVMRLSRNRNWGHPSLIAFLERFASKVPEINGWPGLLLGDMAQPRGGPMITGHASHQIGLDADIWLTPMPDRELSRPDRENMSAVNMVRADWLEVDDSKWTPGHMKLLKAAAEDPAVQRIFVNPAIKKAMCRDAGRDRAWLNKVRPFYGHNYHFHVRLACPRGEEACTDQDPVPAGDGCDASLDYWFSDAVLHPKPNPNYKPKPPLTMAQLPGECREVLVAR